MQTVKEKLDFLETAEILETSIEQILAWKMRVQYLGFVRMRCNLVSKTLSNEMHNVVNSIEKK